MIKRILLICSILSAVQYEGGEQIRRTIYLEGMEFEVIVSIKNVPPIVNIDPDAIQEAFIKEMDLSEILPNNTPQDILPKKIETLEDCVAAWDYYCMKMHEISAQFAEYQPQESKDAEINKLKTELYTKHKPHLNEMEKFLCEAVRENGGRTSIPIERANGARLVFQLASPESLLSYERVIPFLSTSLLHQDGNAKLRGILQACRTQIARVKQGDSYEIFRQHEYFRYILLKQYSKPNCPPAPFQFNDPSLQHVGPEIDGLDKYFISLREKYPTPLEKFIKEYKKYLTGLKTLWLRVSASNDQARQQQFIRSCDYIEKKLLTDKVHKIINTAFNLNDKLVYPQLLEALITLFQIVDLNINPEDPEILNKIILPGYRIATIEDLIKKCIRIIADGKTYREVNVNVLQHERKAISILANTHPICRPGISYSESFIDYLYGKACQFICNGHVIKQGFYEWLPGDLDLLDELAEMRM